MPASLFPGNPVDIGMPVVTTGVGKADVTTALANFQAAIGGVSNNGKASPQTGGFRTINWDGVKVDGTDSGGPPNTTVIHTGDVVGIPLNRFQGQGVSFEEVYAVSNNGFATVNTNAAGLFPAFSTPNTFAMFNDNTIDMSFVLPSTVTSTPVPAAIRGFGAVFINAQIADSSSIEYFSGDRSLGKFSVPVSPTAGDPEFLGVLFSSPLVTRVQLILGTETLFTFNGQTTTGTTVNDATHNLVVTDDFDYAEPVPLPNLPPVGAGARNDQRDDDDRHPGRRELQRHGRHLFDDRREPRRRPVQGHDQLGGLTPPPTGP